MRNNLAVIAFVAFVVCLDSYLFYMIGRSVESQAQCEARGGAPVGYTACVTKESLK